MLLFKKKNQILDPSEITVTENNYSVISEIPHIEGNSGPDARLITERNPQDLSEFSLPVPPLEPELIPLDVWKRENENLALYNPYYASTATSSNNLSGPPDYESIQDVKQSYLLLGGNLDLDSGLQLETYKPSQVDHMVRSRTKREAIGVNKVSLLGEGRFLDEDTPMLTTENCIYGSETATFGCTAENSLYESEQPESGHELISHTYGSRGQNFLYGSDNMFPNPASTVTTSSGEFETIEADQNVPNDHEAVMGGVPKSEHSNSSPSILPQSQSLTQRGSSLDEQNTGSLKREGGDNEPTLEPLRSPTYSKVDIVEKKRRREMASNCNDSDSDNLESPPPVPSYHPNFDSMEDPMCIPLYPPSDPMCIPSRPPSDPMCIPSHPPSDGGDDDNTEDLADQQEDGICLVKEKEVCHPTHPTCGDGYEHATCLSSIDEGEVQ